MLVCLEELPLSKRDFEKLLLEAVDEGLFSLGESSRRAIYFHLKENFSIKKQEIPHKIEVFADSIVKIFGPGADFLKILIMKHLHEKIGGIFELHESTDFAFTEYVTAARRSFVEKNRIKDISEMIVKCGKVGIKG